MAYLPDNDPNAMTGGPVQRGGGGTFGSGAGGGSSQKPTQSGMFTNLQGYLGANQGQGGAMVDKAVAPVNQAYNTAISTADSMSQNNPSPGSIKTRSEFAEGPEGLSAFGSYLNTVGYASAPNILSATASPSGIVNSAMSQYGGTTQALGDWVTSNTKAKTGGGNLLNSAIAGQDPSFKSSIGDTRNKWSGLSGYLNLQQDRATNAANDFNTSLDTRKAYVSKNTGAEEKPPQKPFIQIGYNPYYQ